MASQTSSVTTTIALDNVQADMSTKIGLQGEDFANLLSAMNNKDIINTQAILAQTNQLSKIAESSQGLGQTALKQLFGGDIKKMVIAGVVAVLGCFVLFKYSKKGKK